MSEFKIVDDVPAAFRVVPLQRVETALGCSRRTLLKRLDAWEIPITRVSHNTQGLIIPDLERLVMIIRPGIELMLGRNDPWRTQ
jgi:hypothetical protein